MKVEHIDFEYFHGLQLAEIATEVLYRTGKYKQLDFGEFLEYHEDEVVQRLVIPRRHTILHLYLEYIFNQFQFILNNKVSEMDAEYITNYIVYLNVIGEEYNFGMDVSTALERINECGYCKRCGNCEALKSVIEDIHKWINMSRANIIQTTFHILIQNKNFLKKMHENIAAFMEDGDSYDGFLTIINKGFPKRYDKTSHTIKRLSYWPAWLKQGIMFRDKGVCVICRKDLTGLYNSSSDLNLDHIVPLAKKGNNDPTNLQLMCQKHNLEKLHLSNQTSNKEVPLWNLYTPREFTYEILEDGLTVSLEWKRDKQVQDYMIYRDDDLIFTGPENSITDTVKDEGMYIYRLEAILKNDQSLPVALCVIV